MFNEIIYDNVSHPNDLFYVKMAGELLPDNDFSITRENNSLSIIMYIKSGCVDINGSNVKFTANEGDVLILPQGFCCNMKSNLLFLPTMYWMSIGGKWFEKAYKMYFEDMAFVSRKCDCSKYFENIKSLIAKIDSDGEITKNVLSILNDAYFADRYDIKNNKVDLQNYYDKYISEYIYKRKAFSVDKMAVYFNESTDTLTNKFKAFYGVTPYQYYNSLRLKIAYSLITETKLTIDKISDNLQFSSRNYFSLVFKQKFDISPAKCRKSTKNGILLNNFSQNPR